MKKTMKASSLRKGLTALLIIMILGAGAGFYYGLEQIRAFSIEVRHTAADANASADAIDELQKLKQALAERESLVAKANQVFATESNFQSQALKDIQKYASAIGLTISNTNFEVEKGAITTPSSLLGKPFSITVQSPVSYKKFLQLLDAIEGNVPKMQIASIEVSRPDKNDSDQVKTGNVKIVIATR
jgi:hypothetical protein